MAMPGRRYAAENFYRYGFNGKENDDEVKGLGNQQDYGFRIYDLRLGKFLSVDPLTKGYPMFSPYQFAGNRPIVAIDLEGLEPQEHPYQLKPIGKPYIGVTKEGHTYQAYQVNSPSYGITWVVKISQKVESQNGFEMKPIEHFMYHIPEGGWQPWQRGDEPSIRFKQINQVANGIGAGFYGIVAVGAAAPAAINLAPALVSIPGKETIGLEMSRRIGGAVVDAGFQVGKNQGFDNFNVWSTAGQLATGNPFGSAAWTSMGEQLNAIVGGEVGSKEFFTPKYLSNLAFSYGANALGNKVGDKITSGVGLGSKPAFNMWSNKEFRNSVLGNISGNSSAEVVEGYKQLNTQEPN